MGARAGGGREGRAGREWRMTRGGFKHMALRTRYSVLGTRYLAMRTWYSVLRTLYRLAVEGGISTPLNPATLRPAPGTAAGAVGGLRFKGGNGRRR